MVTKDSEKSAFTDKPAPGTEIVENTPKNACENCNKSIDPKIALNTKNMVTKDMAKTIYLCSIKCFDDFDAWTKLPKKKKRRKKSEKKSER